jgi:hypothetical protein
VDSTDLNIILEVEKNPLLCICNNRLFNYRDQKAKEVVAFINIAEKLQEDGM